MKMGQTPFLRGRSSTLAVNDVLSVLDCFSVLSFFDCTCSRQLLSLTMNKKLNKTLNAIFSDPVNDNIDWKRIESLLIAVGYQVIEGSKGVTFEKDGIKEYFHRPHPERDALMYRVRAARAFLIKLGAKP